MAAPTISVVDNGSKSVTVTLSGAELGDGVEVTVRAARWNGREGPSTWVSVGTITIPDTELTVTMPSFGLYVFFATTLDPTPEETDPQFTNLYYCAVVDESLSLFMQCETAIVERIQALNLTGYGTRGDEEYVDDIGDRVYPRLVPHDLDSMYPCVFVVSNEGMEKIDENLAGTNLMSNVGHPFKVLISLKANVNQDVARRVFSKWRQTVRRAFDKVRLPIPNSPWTTVEPGPRLQQYAYPDRGGSGGAYEFIATVLTIRATTREPRGV